MMNFQTNPFQVEILHRLNPVGISEILSKVQWIIEPNVCEDKLANWKVNSAHSDWSCDSWTTDKTIWTYRGNIIHALV